MGNYIIILIAGITFIISYLVTFLVKKIAKHVNAIDVPNKRSEHTLHTEPIPRMGGLAFFVALIVGCVFFVDVSKEMIAILIGSFVIILAGIIDDIKPIKAKYKFMMQTVGALIAVLYGGIHFTEISLFNFTIPLNIYVAQFLSVFFILAITNAINLIDGLDGLATGLGLIYFITIGLIGFILDKTTGLDIKLIFIMIGATLGFLIHNFPKAKVFLGDTGSMFLGFIIPIVALLGLRDGTLPSALIPILALGLPIFDTIMAMIRRSLKGKKISSPDKEHFHHQILKLNLPLYASVLILYSASILFSILTIFYAFKMLVPTIILAVIILAIFLYIIFNTEILFNKKKLNKDEIKLQEEKQNKKKQKKYKMIFINIFKKFLSFIYFFIKLLPTKKKITLISRQDNKPSMDFLLLKEKILELMPGYKVKILTKKVNTNSLKSIFSYSFHIIRQMINIATSKIVILDGYCIPISVLKHKKSLKVIQMWHSIGTMKKFGIEILNKEEGVNKELANVMKMHRNYNYIFASGNGYKKELASQFGYSEDFVKIFPLPRTDYLLSEDIKNKKSTELYNKFTELKNKENVVYCPTHRKNELALEKAILNLEKNFDFEKYNLIIKLHPLSKIKISDTRIFKLQGISSLDTLFIADYLISDYSCIIYEAALLKIPFFLYVFDYDKYIESRGLWLDLKKEVPGIVSKDVKEILKALKKDNTKIINEQETFLNKYVSIEKGMSTTNIVNFLKEI